MSCAPQLGRVALGPQKLPLKRRKLNKKQTWNTGYWLLASQLLLWLQVIWQNANQSEVVPCSAFEQALSEGRIDDVVVNDLTMTGCLNAPDGYHTVPVTARVEPDLAARRGKHQLPYRRVLESPTW